MTSIYLYIKLFYLFNILGSILLRVRNFELRHVLRLASATFLGRPGETQRCSGGPRLIQFPDNRTVVNRRYTVFLPMYETFIC